MPSEISLGGNWEGQEQEEESRNEDLSALGHSVFILWAYRASIIVRGLACPVY
jgi:hypothetical protein